MLRTLMIYLWLLSTATTIHAATVNIKQAQKLFSRAEAEYRRGHFAQALEYYQQTMQQWRHPNFIFNIAQCHRQLRQFSKALYYYQLFLAEWAKAYPGKPPASYEEVQELIRQLKEKMAGQPQPSPQPGQARVYLQGLPSNAIVKINGAIVAPPPLHSPLVLKGGAYRLSIEAEGYESVSKHLEINDGEEQVEQFSLLPKGREEGWSKLWLGSGITSGALSLGFFITGVVYDFKIRDTDKGTQEYDQTRSLRLMGYVLAGVLAAASAGSFYLYFRRGKTRHSAAALIAPIAGGVAVTGALTF